jgi:hypothetical protein
MAKIEPFSIKDQVYYGKNGLILFIAPQGGGKSYTLCEFILLTERLYQKPFFQNIIYCSTNDGLDKTLGTFKKQFTKYQINDKKIQRMDGDIEVTMKKRQMKYVEKKLRDYGTPEYPSNTLLILDDFMGSDLLERKESPVVKLMSKLRHYNITTIVSQQSTKGIGRTVRRLTSDCVLWKGIGYEDFMKLLDEMPISLSKDYLWSLYQTLKNKHDYIEIHPHCEVYEVRQFNQ